MLDNWECTCCIKRAWVHGTDVHGRALPEQMPETD